MNIEFDPNAFDQKGRLRIEKAGIDITIFKRNGKFFAANSKCPHKGGPMFLAKNVGEMGIMCPSHHIIFNVESGEVMENPIPKTMGDYALCNSLKTYKIDSNDGKYYVIVD